MSLRYVDFHEKVKEADALVVIGFGFGRADGHVNSIVRDAIERRSKRLVIVRPTKAGSDAAGAARDVAQRLGLDDESQVSVVFVDEARKSEGRSWIEAAAAAAEGRSPDGA